MASNQNNSNGDNTPKTYKLYTDTYDFNNLQKRIDSGIERQISSLKYGEKYANEFRDAVYNILSGVGDGTITFENGRFNDSKGRYTNNENKKKDVYGWAANYVYNQMVKANKYQAPEDTSKTQWNDNAGTQAFLKDIFNSNTPNYSYFIELDPYNPETGVRDTTQRAATLTNWITSLQNDYDNRFKGYTDAQRNDYKRYLQEALNTLNDGLQSSDYLALSRVLPGIDFNKMFFTGEHYISPQEQQKLTPEQQKLQAQQQFYDYIAQQHPLYNGDLTSQVLDNSVSEETDILTDALGKKSNEELLQFDIDKLPDNYKNVLVNTLIAKSLIPYSDQDKVFVLPQSLNNESILTYDPKTRKLSRKRTHELSYYRQQWINDYIKKYGTSTDQLSQYFTEFKKQGGVIKAESGVKFSDNYDWYNGIFMKNFGHILQALQSNSGYANWLNNMQGNHASIYHNAGDNWQNIAYKDNTVGDYQDAYKAGFNNEWKDNVAGYNSLGIQNAVDQGMFTINGKRTSGDNSQSNWVTDKLYSAETDSRRLLGRKGDFTVQQLFDITNKLRNVGYDIYLDKDDYYKVRRLEQPLDNELNTLKQIKVDDPINPGDTTKKDNSTKITRVPGEGNDTGKTDIWGRISGYVPDVLSAVRLGNSIRTNNKIANVLRDATKPVLLNTYERYSPVTGAFGYMQFMNGQAADIRRQTARPFTSDASLQLAGELEANRQARTLEQQGFLADNQEIKRTQAEALARQEDNMARRSENANRNRLAINQNNRELAQIDAVRRKQNWQSVDNFMKDLETRMRTQFAQDRALKQATSTQAASDTYQQAISDYNKLYREQNPNATTTTMANDQRYIDAMQQLRRRYQYDLNNISRGIFINNPYKGSTIPTYDEILSSYKKGGVLRPNIINLINKVIKDENNT